MYRHCRAVHLGHYTSLKYLQRGRYTSLQIFTQKREQQPSSTYNHESKPNYYKKNCDACNQSIMIKTDKRGNCDYIDSIVRSSELVKVKLWICLCTESSICLCNNEQIKLKNMATHKSFISYITPVWTQFWRQLSMMVTVSACSCWLLFCDTICSSFPTSCGQRLTRKSTHAWTKGSYRQTPHINKS